MKSPIIRVLGFSVFVLASCSDGAGRAESTSERQVRPSPPAVLAKISPKPGTKYIPDADGGGQAMWPATVEEACSLLPTFAVSGTITSVTAEEQILNRTPDPQTFGVGVGQHAQFVPDNVISLTWVEESWSAPQTDLTPEKTTALSWFQTPIAHVNPNGELVDYNVDGLVHEEDLIGRPPGFEPGTQVLALFGIGYHALPGSEILAQPTLAGLFEIKDGMVIQSDGTKLDFEYANVVIKDCFTNAILDYQRTLEVTSQSAEGEAP